MTDLINRVNELEASVVESLIIKYGPALAETKYNKLPDAGYFAFALNISVNYLNANYKDLHVEWKSWCSVLIKRLFEQEVIKSKEDIFKYIDEFLKYKKSEYKKYVSNIALYSDEYYRDSPFVDRFIKQL